MDKARDLKAIGARIRAVRRSRGISQEDAARLAGIDHPTAASGTG